MSIFDPIDLVWQGQTYTIQPDRVLGAIARIEEVMTLKEIHESYTQRGSIALSKVAQAYGAVLRWAGAQASNDEVYSSLFDGSSDGAAVQQMLQALLLMLTPPQRSAAPLGESRPR